MALYKAGIQFEDCRLPHEEFFKRKAAGEFQFGTVPVLELPDGRIIAQLQPILKFICSLNGLEAADPKKRALGKSFATYAFDDFAAPKIYAPLLAYMPGEPQVVDDLMKIHFPAFCKKLDERLEKCGTKYLAGDCITEHDFIVGGLFANMFCNPN